LLWCAKRAKKRLSTFGIDVEIEDLVNAGWLRNLRRFREGELKGKSRFLLTIMIGYGFKQRCPEYTSLTDMGVHDADPVASSYHTIDDLDDLEFICDGMPTRLLEVIKILYFDGKTLQQAGEMLDISPQRVRQLKTRFIDRALERYKKSCNHRN
jgi:RNA polymerase sigma factor (sigma-70 family)